MVLKMKIELLARQVLERAIFGDFSGVDIIATEFTVPELWPWKEPAIRKHNFQKIAIKHFSHLTLGIPYITISCWFSCDFT